MRLLLICLMGLCGQAAADDCVILLHGIARSPESLSPLTSALEKEGYRAKSFDYPDTESNLTDIVTTIAPSLNSYANQCTGKVHVVTHSMGGLVARAWLNRHRPANLGHVVMLAPPNQGSEVADALQSNPLYTSFFGPAGQQLTTQQSSSLTALLGTPSYPLGIIAGTRSINFPASWFILPGSDDGAVTVSRTLIAHAISHPETFITIPTTHTFMMSNAQVQNQTLHFLKHGKFKNF